MTSSRIASMPDIPSISEVVEGYDVTPWYGIFAPSGTDPEIVERLNQAVNEALQSPGLKKTLNLHGIETASLSQADFAKLIDEELQLWTEVVKQSRASVD